MRQKITEVKVACQEKAKKFLARREKNTRVESGETQDYVREAKSTDKEEAEELSFVPSAITVPQKLMLRCDHQCSGKTSNNTDKFVVETVRRAKGAPWNALEDDGKRSTCARNVGILLPRKR